MSSRHRAVVLALSLLPGLALAEPPPDPEALDRMIERSGLRRQLELFEDGMLRAVAELGAKQRLDPEFLERLQTTTARAYAQSSLQPILHAELARTLAPADVEAVLAWSASPAGRRIAAIGERNASLEERRRIEAAVAQGTPALAPARTQLLHQVVSATRADELGVTLVFEAALGSAEGHALSGPESSRATVRLMRAGMQSDRAMVVPEMHERSFAWLAVSHAEATDAELEALLRFARSAQGAHFFRSLEQAFGEVARQAALNAAVASDAAAAAAAPADL